MDNDKDIIVNIMKYLAQEGCTIEDATKILDATKVQLNKVVLTENNPLFNLY